jgi:hypothetical protein
MLAVFLLLAWLTFRSEDTPAAISVLYLVAMLYGLLMLDRVWLGTMALVAMVTHGVAIFVLIDTGHRINFARRPGPNTARSCWHAPGSPTPRGS